MNGVVMTGVQVTTDWQEPVAGRIKKCHTLIFYKGQELYIIPANASFISIEDAKTFGAFHQMVGIYYDDRSNVIFEASRRRGNMSGSIQLDSLAGGKGPTNFGPDNFERALPGQDPKNPNCALARVEKRGGQFFLINAYGERRIRKII